MQLDKLGIAGAEKIFQEKKTGASRDGREALAAALDFVREGDVFIVTRLDRLARSVLDLTTIVDKLAAKKVDLLVIDQAIDTTTPTGRLMLHVLAALAEFERELIKERAADGIAKAKAAGVHF